MDLPKEEPQTPLYQNITSDVSNLSSNETKILLLFENWNAVDIETIYKIDERIILEFTKHSIY